MIREDSAATVENGRIMLVEKDVQTGKEISDVLLQQNAKLVWATSAAEAMQILNDVLFIGSGLDGLLVNQSLPDASANRVIREFRHEFPWAPIAMMMNADDISTSVWARSRQIKILRRPIQPEELSLWLKHVKVSV